MPGGTLPACDVPCCTAMYLSPPFPYPTHSEPKPPKPKTFFARRPGGTSLPPSDGGARPERALGQQSTSDMPEQREVPVGTLFLCPTPPSFMAGTLLHSGTTQVVPMHASHSIPSSCRLRASKEASPGFPLNTFTSPSPLFSFPELTYSPSSLSLLHLTCCRAYLVGPFPTSREPVCHALGNPHPLPRRAREQRTVSSQTPTMQSRWPSNPTGWLHR